MEANHPVSRLPVADIGHLFITLKEKGSGRLLGFKVILNSRNVSYEGVSVNSFEELTKEILAIS